MAQVFFLMHVTHVQKRQLGESFYNLGELDKALDQLNKAIELMKETIPVSTDFNFATTLISAYEDWESAPSSGSAPKGFFFHFHFPVFPCHFQI